MNPSRHLVKSLQYRGILPPKLAIYARGKQRCNKSQQSPKFSLTYLLKMLLSESLMGGNQLHISNLCGLTQTSLMILQIAYSKSSKCSRRLLLLRIIFESVLLCQRHWHYEHQLALLAVNLFEIIRIVVIKVGWVARHLGTQLLPLIIDALFFQYVQRLAFKFNELPFLKTF